jgi:hypothetical protein
VTITNHILNRQRPNQLLPQQRHDQHNPDHRHGQINRKTPPPARLRQIPPSHRPNTETQPRHKRKQTPVLCILPQRDAITQYRTNADINPRRSNALQGAAEQEDGKRVCGRGCAQRRADRDDSEGGLERGVPAKDVGQLGEDGEEGGRGEVEGGDDPV